jgi:protein-S-isoprenylcysteine O-methyltransferase Ste14
MATHESEELRDRSLAELARGLSQDVSTLVRQEAELAKAEVREKARTAAPGAGMLAGAAVVALAMLGAFTAFFILVLGLALPAWLAALIVTVVYAAIAAVLALQGRERLRRAAPPVPERAIESTKEDVDYAKARMRSSRSEGGDR